MQLPIDVRLKNIEDTEAAKKLLLEATGGKWYSSYLIDVHIAVYPIHKLYVSVLIFMSNMYEVDTCCLLFQSVSS